MKLSELKNKVEELQFLVGKSAVYEIRISITSDVLTWTILRWANNAVEYLENDITDFNRIIRVINSEIAKYKVLNECK